MQDCSISSANALEILQSCTKPSICTTHVTWHGWTTCCWALPWLVAQTITTHRWISSSQLNIIRLCHVRTTQWYQISIDINLYKIFSGNKMSRLQKPQGTVTNKQNCVWLMYIDRLVQERRNSSALALELRLSCNNPLIWSFHLHHVPDST